ncbi:hypothetical protein J2S53_001416 [Actinopolyspora lacussalsi]|nr:hypothetical protein [Actinopolyspora lacussalsi]
MTVNESNAVTSTALDAQQDALATRLATESHAATIVADARGVPVADVVARSTRNMVHGPDGQFIEVAFPSPSTEAFSAGGINIVPSRESVSVDRAVTMSAEASITARAGQLNSFTFGEKQSFTGAELADHVAAQRRTASVPDVQAQNLITNVTDCLVAGGVIVTATGLVLAAIGCGTICSALIVGTATAAIAPFVCAGCIGAALGAPTGVIYQCLTSFT